jgi:hypothetical protein
VKKSAGAVSRLKIFYLEESRYLHLNPVREKRGK